MLVQRLTVRTWYSVCSRSCSTSSPSAKSQQTSTLTESESETSRNEEFRELYIMPKRKIQVQLAIERLTGRAEVFKRAKVDLQDRLAVRRPRRENMKSDQDWVSVYPAAATFNASSVPLPIRMGYRRHVNRRPPFKTTGNLELMKIPNFLHLSPKHVERHCEAIKKFCTDFPSELKTFSELTDKYFPITVKYSDYIHQGTSIRDMRSRIVTVSMKLSRLKLDEHANEKIKRLLGNKYDEETATLTIVNDRCVTRKQNRDYADYLLTALFYESQKVEEWEKQLKTREDNLKVEFEGSTAQKWLENFYEKCAESMDRNALDTFAKTWCNYRNSLETEESARSYEESVRKLLGIEGVSKQKECKHEQPKI